MPHTYPLHTDVTAPCLCCQAPRAFRFTSPSDQVVCAECVRHIGPDRAEKRDADHVSMWAALYAAEQERHLLDNAAADQRAASDAATIEKLSSSVQQLTTILGGDFSAGPSAEMRSLLESDVTGRAERSTELANRRTDRAMAVLWQLGRLHRDDDATPGRCSCGRSLAACEENKLLNAQATALADWERKNLAQLAAGGRHALPTSHPAVATAPPPARRGAPGR